MEATQLFTGRWMDKQNVVYTYSGILFSLEKEGNSDINYDMDEPCGQYAKWNKPVTKRQILGIQSIQSSQTYGNKVEWRWPAIGGRTIQKKILMTQLTMMVWSLT